MLVVRNVLSNRIYLFFSADSISGKTKTIRLLNKKGKTEHEEYINYAKVLAWRFALLTMHSYVNLSPKSQKQEYNACKMRYLSKLDLKILFQFLASQQLYN